MDATPSKDISIALHPFWTNRLVNCFGNLVQMPMSQVPTKRLCIRMQTLLELVIMLFLQTSMTAAHLAHTMTTATRLCASPQTSPGAVLHDPDSVICRDPFVECTAAHQASGEVPLHLHPEAFLVFLGI